MVSARSGPFRPMRNSGRFAIGCSARIRTYGRGRLAVTSVSGTSLESLFFVF
jgi:hypothetical protein